MTVKSLNISSSLAVYCNIWVTPLSIFPGIVLVSITSERTYLEGVFANYWSSSQVDINS
jgi:hypothetical protein